MRPGDYCYWYPVIGAIRAVELLCHSVLDHGRLSVRVLPGNVQALAAYGHLRPLRNRDLVARDNGRILPRLELP